MDISGIISNTITDYLKPKHHMYKIGIVMSGINYDDDETSLSTCYKERIVEIVPAIKKKYYARVEKTELEYNSNKFNYQTNPNGITKRRRYCSHEIHTNNPSYGFPYSLSPEYYTEDKSVIVELDSPKKITETQLTEKMLFEFQAKNYLLIEVDHNENYTIVKAVQLA